MSDEAYEVMHDAEARAAYARLVLMQDALATARDLCSQVEGLAGAFNAHERADLYTAAQHAERRLNVAAQAQRHVVHGHLVAGAHRDQRSLAQYTADWLQQRAAEGLPVLPEVGNEPDVLVRTRDEAAEAFKRTVARRNFEEDAAGERYDDAVAQYDLEQARHFDEPLVREVEKQREDWQ